MKQDRTKTPVRQADRFDDSLNRVSTMELRLAHPPSTLDLPRRVIDPATRMSTITALHQELASVLDASKRLAVFYVHLPNSTIIEDRYGWKATESYLGAAADYLKRETKKIRQRRRVASLNSAFGDDFLIVCPQGDRDEELVSELTTGLERHLARAQGSFSTTGHVYLGRSSLQQLPRLNRERLVYRAVRNAQQQAMDAGRFILQSQARLLDACLEKSAFYMVYQPIVSVGDLGVYGHEALVRSNREELANPYVLLDVAQKTGRTHALGRHLRRLAFTAVDQLPDHQLLFLNVHPEDLDDPELLDPPDWMAEIGPRVVLEITERTAISDFGVLRSRIQKLKRMGFRVAIDDLGSGYSTLSSVAHLEPEIVKFDMLLVRSIEQSRLRQRLLGQLVDFAKAIDCQVVAEGVETKAEYETVEALGCHLCQGFYLARPSKEIVTEVQARTSD